MSHRTLDGEPEAQAQAKRDGTSETPRDGKPQPVSRGIPRHVMSTRSKQLPCKFSQSLSSVQELSGASSGATGFKPLRSDVSSGLPPRGPVAGHSDAVSGEAVGEAPDIEPNFTLRPSRIVINPSAAREQEVAPDAVPQTPSRACVSRNTFEAAFAELQRAADIIATPFKSPKKAPKAGYLNKDSNTKGFVAWDVDERLIEFDSKFNAFQDLVHGSLSDRKLLDETIEFLKLKRMFSLFMCFLTKYSQLRAVSDAESKNEALVEKLDASQRELRTLTLALDSEKRAHQHDVEDKTRESRHELDQLRRDLSDEAERQRRDHREQLEATERHWKNTLEDVEVRKAREVEQLRIKVGTEQDDLQREMSRKDREVENMRVHMEELKSSLDREKTLKDNFTLQLAARETSIVELQAKNRSLQNRIDFLESDSKAQSDSFANMESKLRDAERVRDKCKTKLIREETERRILFNKYQELKGNIRVMCRVRPAMSPEGAVAQMQFPDIKTSAEIQVMGPEERSSLGNVTRKTNSFEFDRVFDPDVANEEVFDEISQLVQSALDGYNVCIFCYGQTGSGKTYTMSSPNGMIPRATHMIYDTMTKLKEKSWAYHMEGCFVEVYNEELHDLLGDNGKKLEIRHDEVKKRTNISNCHTVSLDSTERVESILDRAQKNRSVAATKANEHSSRSHSVFILRLQGTNAATGETCEGTLNLVDLAGSERLKQSQAEGERMKETQNINKSLSSLGDVIEALGNKQKTHIPYRNSKLTHLLQYSLGGNSKTLMFVMISPLEAHLQETLASLKFATKVCYLADFELDRVTTQTCLANKL